MDSMNGAPNWAYMLRFPARNDADRTNKFGLFFDDINNREIDVLRNWFGERLTAISDKPDSFHIWKQETGKDHGLTFLMVDMDQLQVSDIEKASKELETQEESFRLRQNNREAYIGIEWPCACCPSKAPFPFFKQAIGTNDTISHLGYWHDPNMCPPFEPRSRTGDNTGTANIGYTPVANPVFMPSAQAVLTPKMKTVASSAPVGPIAEAASIPLSPGAAAAASPTRRVRYAPRLENGYVHTAPYAAVMPQPYDVVEPMPRYYAIEPGLPYTASELEPQYIATELIPQYITSASILTSGVSVVAPYMQQVNVGTIGTGNNLDSMHRFEFPIDGPMYPNPANGVDGGWAGPPQLSTMHGSSRILAWPQDENIYGAESRPFSFDPGIII
ncbi:hypothetical protein F5Y16DRAFT_402256 [Xylariaceae sp. FL0255]|nr:hypothetical protein F5Y16DRAFT_402256 [Xylariaceae sp. FL0255]